MYTELRQLPLSTIARLIRPGRDGEIPEWDPNPEFQRDLVWSTTMKRDLMDSASKGYPFGQIMVVEIDGKKMILDGKQRTNALVSFMEGQFTDGERKLWSDWSAEEKALYRNIQISVQYIRMEDEENMSDVVELFRRVNTHGKKLSPGQLVKSCSEMQMLKLVNWQFYMDPSESAYEKEIASFRQNWGRLFSKNGKWRIKENKSRGDLMFFTAITTAFTTGNNAAITSSFPILHENGLKYEPNSSEVTRFWEKMNLLVSILSTGVETGYIKKSASGYPSLSTISPFIKLVNEYYGEETSENCKNARYIVDDHEHTADHFFKFLKTHSEFETYWFKCLRRNRTEANLQEEFEMMHQIAQMPVDTPATHVADTIIRPPPPFDVIGAEPEEDEEEITSDSE